MAEKAPTPIKAKASGHDGINQALIAAQRDMGTGVPKDGVNPAFRTKYASLESVLDTITKPLHDNGLAAYQTIDTRDTGEIVLVTTLVHADTGEKIESRAPVRCKDRDDPQKIGGAITYMRRYSLLALLGLAPEDDDGQAAAQPPRPRQEPAPPSNAPPRSAQGAIGPSPRQQPELGTLERTVANFEAALRAAVDPDALVEVANRIRDANLPTGPERDRLIDVYTARLKGFQTTG